MPFFSSFTGSFSGGRRKPISIGGGGGGGGAVSYTWSLVENASATVGTGIGTANFTNQRPPHLQFRDSGNKLTFLAQDTVPQGTIVSMSTAYDVATGTATNFAGGFYTNKPVHWINANGTKVYAFESGVITGYELSIPYDIGAVWSNGSGTATSLGTATVYNSISFHNDITEVKMYDSGAKMIIMDDSGRSIIFDLSTNYDPLSATVNTSNTSITTDIYDGPATWKTFTWSDDGATLFGFTGTRFLRQYTASTPWDIDTLTLVSSKANPDGDRDSFGFELDHENGRLYFVRQGSSINYWDIGVASGGGGGGGGSFSDFSSTTLAYTLDNPNAYGTSAADKFGDQVAISDSYAIVGTRYEDDAGGFNSGKAYIYNLSDGSLAYTLDNPNAYGTSGSDDFGNSVAISSNYAIVGARYEDDAGGLESGKAYVYDLSDGSLTYTFDNPNAYDTGAGDQFGNSVAMSDTYAIVGAPYEDDASGLNSGKAYIFNLSDGSLTYTLDNPNAYDTSAGDRFGEVVAINDSYAIVGASGEDDAGGTFSGKAYIFDLSDGSLTYTLDNPNAYGTSASDLFSNAVAISDSYAIVGAKEEDDAGGTASGKAYVFDLSDGSLLYTLDNPNAYDTSASDRFGFSVSINDSYAIVGAYLEDEAAGTSSGKVYVFDLSDGSLVNTLDNPNAYDTVIGDYFGTAVAIGSEYIIVGATDEDDAGGGLSGKAYIFKGALTGGGGGGAATYSLDGATQSGSGTNITSGNNPRFFVYNSDGTKVFTCEGNRIISELNLSTAYDVSTTVWSYTVQSGDLDNITAASIDGAAFSPDGTTVIVCHQTSSPDSQQITQYDLTSAFDLSTISNSVATLDVVGDIPGSLAGVGTVVFNDDGSKLFVGESVNDLILEYSLSSAYDISTATYTTSFDYGTATGSSWIIEMIFNATGTKLLVADSVNDKIWEIDLSTGFDLSTATYNSNNIDFSSIDGIPAGLAYNDDESKLYVAGGQNRKIYTFDLVQE